LSSLKAAIMAVGTTDQGVHPDKTVFELAIDAVRDLLIDSGRDCRDEIDGLLTWEHPGESLDPLDIAYITGTEPKVTASLGYGTAGFTTQHAAMLVATGTCRAVLCVFARNPRGAMVKYAGGPMGYDDSGLANVAGAAAMGWQLHMSKYGSTEEALGNVVVASRAWAALNPIAAWRDPLSLDDYLASAPTLWPFRPLDICRQTAGAVALLITSTDLADEFAKPPVYLHASGRQIQPDPLTDPDHLLCTRGMKSVAQQIYNSTGTSADDIDILYLSDAHSSAIPHTLENYGFCGPGESPDYVADGAIGPGGSGTPVNTNGGQLSEGYLVGWLHHAELVRQLRGECGERQVAGARTALYTSTGRFRNDYVGSYFSNSAEV
jgi:acetyl-CoA acetyltransferase